MSPLAGMYLTGILRQTRREAQTATGTPDGPNNVSAAFVLFHLNDIGVDRHHNDYFPVSPIHEPFSTLFIMKPGTALGLVRDLANRATKGWRQVHLLTASKWEHQLP
jgi:hypothetical protein